MLCALACLDMCCSPHEALGCASRLEARAPREELLEELNAFTVGVDRPSYGQSDPHPRRSFQSWAEDVAHLADALSIKSFFVVGVRCVPGSCKWHALLLLRCAACT